MCVHRGYRGPCQENAHCWVFAGDFVRAAVVDSARPVAIESQRVRADFATSSANGKVVVRAFDPR